MLNEDLTRVRKIARGAAGNQIAEALQDVWSRMEKLETKIIALEKAIAQAKAAPKETKK